MVLKHFLVERSIQGKMRKRDQGGGTVMDYSVDGMSGVKSCNPISCLSHIKIIQLWVHM